MTNRGVRLGSQEQPRNSVEQSPGVCGTDATGAGIDAWLHALGHMLALPPVRRQEIVAELEAHLHERVRDLMLEGQDETRATHQAIAELGDAAVVADRFRRVEGSPTRRLMMNAVLVGTTAAAVGLCVVGFQSFSASPSTQTAAPTAQQEGTASSAGDTPSAGSNATATADATIVLDEGDTLESFVTKFASSFNVPAFVYWDRLKELKIEPGARFHVPSGAMSRLEAWRLVNDALPGGNSPLGWRLRNDRLEVSLQEHLDRREIELAVYDLSSVLDGASHDWRSATLTNAVALVQSTIEPSYWGSQKLASIHTVDDKVFVRAPRRLQSQVSWVMQAITGTQRGSMSVDDPNPVPLRRSPEQAQRDAQIDLIRSELVRIDGLVERGGFFSCPSNDRLTLKRLIAAAGGFAPDARQVTILRMEDNEQTHSSVVPVSDLQQSSTADMELLAGDVIRVE